MSPAMVSVVVGIITAAGAIFAAWLGSRALRWVNQKATAAALAVTELEKRKVDRAEWETLLSEWRNEVRELRRLRSEDRTQFDRELRECRARIDQLEENREQDRRSVRRLSSELQQLAEWSRLLTQLLRANNIEFPAPPFDISSSQQRLPPVNPKESS